MKMTVLQTFEQGMPRADGGMIKLFEGAKLEATQVETGVQVVAEGKVRTIPTAIVAKLETAGLVKLEK
jgi:hypothetical protein